MVISRVGRVDEFFCSISSGIPEGFLGESLKEFFVKSLEELHDESLEKFREESL